MSFTKEYFIIDGKKSSDIGVKGVSLVRTDSEINRKVIGDRNILKDIIKNRNIPYFYGVTEDTIKFDLKFSLLDEELTDDTMFELNTIFAKKYPIPFESMDYPGITFFVICTNITQVTYGSYKGWLQTTVESIAPFGFSMVNDPKDFSDLTSPETFEIYAKFNVMHPKYMSYYYFPKLLIDMKGSATSITLANLSDGNRQFTFTGLNVGESLKVDNDLKSIESSTGLHRISNFNKNWFRLCMGRNLISINQPAIIEFQCMLPVYI